MKRSSYLFGFVCCILLLFATNSFALLRIGQNTNLQTHPYFYGDFDDGGYSDAIYYGPSPEHPVSGIHELLSGEWGAAIYYDGIDTDPIDPASLERKAIWLTKMFSYPNWYTGSDLDTTQTGAGTSRDNLANPGGKNGVPDTGLSTIANDDVEIQIDYEVVDLQYRDPNVWDPNDYLCRSPMGFLEQDTNNPNMLRSAYVYSDRYIFLQTYTIKNISGQTLNNLAFYQLLHSHGADEYLAYVNSTYTEIQPEDPLDNYVPFNSIHQTGNFQYDITQWNGPTISGHYSNHIDFVGFSSTVKPDWIDNDVYQGGHVPGLFKPREGTHINIENRALNGKDYILLDEVAGALGWSLGSMAPSETVKRTVAFMFCYGGKEVTRHHLYVTKTDNVPSCFDSTDPNATITYTINYGNDDPNGTASTESNLILTDYMPQGIDPFSVQVTGGGSYDLFTNKATWTIGTLNDGQSGQKTITFKMAEAQPGGEIENKVVLANDLNSVQYTLYTPVCDVSVGAVVYVDKFAPGPQDGSSWYNAFHDLQAGLDKAATASNPTEVEVWVADGTYKPGTEDGDSFVVSNGIKIYGGFGGYGVEETDKDQRNWEQYKTILSGRILSFPNGTGGEVVYRNNTVIVMGNNSVLDGVTVEEGRDYGIQGNNVSFSIVNCIIKNTLERGVGCQNGNLTIKWCEIKDNGEQGIYHLGSGKLLSIENCKIHDNQRDGILTDQSTSTILNSLIYQNGSGDSYYGIHLGNPSGSTTIRNNTIVQNINEGIRRSGGSIPTIKNNIIYYNNDEGTQLTGLYPNQVTWCCLPDCNDINNQHNINDMPGFVYADPDGRPVVGNYHLVWDSPCIDAGDSNTYTNESDMDGDSRVYGNKVEIGADEVTCTDTSHPNDWNTDGVINLLEFNDLSNAWLTYDPNNPLCDPNNPGYVSDPNAPGYISQMDKERFNPDCDLDNDLDVDLSDLILFCEDDPQVWLWVACWRTDLQEIQQQQSGQMMMSVPSLPAARMIEPSESEISMMETVVIPTEAVMVEDMPVVEEKSIQEQIFDLQDSIEFLEKLWQEESDFQQEINSDEWKEFMDAVYQSLSELEMLQVENTETEE